MMKSEQHFLLQFIFIHSTFLALGTRVLAAYNVSHSSFSKPVTIFKVQLDCHESQSSQCYLHCPCTPLIGCLQQQAQSNHVTKIYSYFCFSAFFFFFFNKLTKLSRIPKPSIKLSDTSVLNRRTTQQRHYLLLSFVIASAVVRKLHVSCKK